MGLPAGGRRQRGGLRPAPRPRSGASGGSSGEGCPLTPKRILFVCTGNSARSQMAEGFARTWGADRLQAFSAGLDPRGLSAHAVDVMRERGIDISAQRSKAFSDELARTVHYVVTVCGNAEERCPLLPPGVKRLHWPLEDPAQARGSPDEVRDAFRRSRDEIERLVRKFLADLDPYS